MIIGRRGTRPTYVGRVPRRDWCHRAADPPEGTTVGRVPPSTCFHAKADPPESTYGVTSKASTHTHDPCALEFRLPVASIVMVCVPPPSPPMLYAETPARAGAA